MESSKRKKVLGILAGGKASRLSGTEKLNLKVGGKRVIERILNSLADDTIFKEALLLLGKKDISVFEPLPNSLIKITPLLDPYPGNGPLLGLLAALEERPTSDIFLCGGDMPFPSFALIKELLKDIEKGFDVSIAESDRGLEPLFAWYSPQVASHALSALAAGKMKIVSFFDQVQVSVMPLKKVRELCDPTICFLNINTKSDLEIARQTAMVLGELRA